MPPPLLVKFLWFESVHLSLSKKLLLFNYHLTYHNWMGLGVSSDHKFSSKFKLFLFRKINVWLYCFLKNWNLKKKKVNFPYNFSGFKLGFLDPLILQQNYQLQIINPLWINKWKILKKKTSLFFFFFSCWLNIVFFYLFFFMLPNTRKYRKLSLYKVFHWNKQNARFRDWFLG